MLSFFPLDVLDEIWDVIESVSEGFLTYSDIVGGFIVNRYIQWYIINGSHPPPSLAAHKVMHPGPQRFM